MKVDLPAPFSPTRPCTSPGRRVSPTPCSTCTPKNDFSSPSATSTGSASRPRLPHRGRAVSFTSVMRPPLPRRRMPRTRARPRSPARRGARRRSRKPVGRRAADRGVGVGHEGVERVLVAHRMPRRHDREPRGVGREAGGVAIDRPWTSRRARPTAARDAPARTARSRRCPTARRSGRSCARAPPATPAACRPRPRRARRPPRRGPPSRCRRSGALLVHRARRGVEPHDPVAGDELDEVDEVRPDVGEGPRRAAERGVDPPVVVVRGGEPVLQVGAVHAEQPTGVAGRDSCPRLARHRVEAVDEGHGGHEAALGGEVDERRGIRRRVARGFSQITCLPASRAARAIAACVALGVHTCTTSMSGSAISASTESKAASRPRRSAASRARPAEEDAPPASSARAARAARECTAAMKPPPTKPARIVRAGAMTSVVMLAMLTQGCQLLLVLRQKPFDL